MDTHQSSEKAERFNQAKCVIIMISAEPEKFTVVFEDGEDTYSKEDLDEARAHCHREDNQGILEWSTLF